MIIADRQSCCQVHHTEQQGVAAGEMHWRGETYPWSAGELPQLQSTLGCFLRLRVLLKPFYKMEPSHVIKRTKTTPEALWDCQPG